jgi:thiamine biosynthesis lipoprotein ApbE/Na+-translocating ferredoxin:NAD+ oxidoreductase RnfG subunit
MQRSLLVGRLVQVWRLLALGLAASLMHIAAPPAGKNAADFSSALKLSDARGYFPKATQLRPAGDGRLEVLDESGTPLGLLVLTSPQSDSIIGYAGPSNLLLAVGTDGRIRGVRLLRSDDTPSHVAALKSAGKFWDALSGWHPEKEPPPPVDGVAGSTLTAFAWVEAIAHRFTGGRVSLRFPEPITMEEVESMFKGAAQMLVDEKRDGWHKVNSADGSLMGYLVRTSPASDDLIGYQGPTECLIAVAADERSLLGVRMRKTYDTPDYADRVREDSNYMKLLTKWTTDQWCTLDFQKEGIEGVAGATMTSYAVAEGIRQTFVRHRRSDKEVTRQNFWQRLGSADAAMAAILAGALALAFSPLRGNRLLRWIWRAVSIGGLGICLGQMLSLSPLVGWAQHGIPNLQAGGFLLLVAMALLVPWGTRRQIYCHHVCPHGAAQEVLGGFTRLHLKIPQSLHQVLRAMPVVTLIGLFLGALIFGDLEVSKFEPFDAWTLGSAAAVPAVLAILGLVASIFVPQAYCHYGCPTGALLQFIRMTSGTQGVGRKDYWALASLIAGAGMVLLRPAIFPTGADAKFDDGSEPAVSRFEASSGSAAAEMRGVAFGTTWCVKVRDLGWKPDGLDVRIAAEMDRIEARLSHWKPDSATSQFNASATVLEMDVEPELVKLVSLAARVSDRTGGMFDITVAPLVSLWGHGPTLAAGSQAGSAPSEAAVKAALEAVGYAKLEVDPRLNTLKKKHPSLTLDLGALLQGYAVDRVWEMLEAAGVKEFLVEVGGELRARGTWLIGIENPAQPGTLLGKVSLKDQALATSGHYRARKLLDGRPATHLISPLTGHPVEAGIELSAVLGSTCVEADAWSTAMILLSPQFAAEIAQMEKREVLLVDREGRFLSGSTIAVEQR